MFNMQPPMVNKLASIGTQHLPWLNEYTYSINTEIAKLFPEKPTTSLERAVRDSLSNSGKRVRAVLSLLICELFSGEYKPAIPIAIAYELAHASALVQDDILDSSELRRGEKSIVSNYGLSNAILASDFLLFNIPKIIARYNYLESSRLSRLFDLVGEAGKGATLGEYLDLEIAKRSDNISEQDYEEMIKSKTATLLATPAASGAIIGNASEEQIMKAYKFGEYLGMAYQIQDDMLDLLGSEQLLGKPVFTDIRAGKKSLILIHCLNYSTETEKKFLLSLSNRIGDYKEEEVAKTHEILENHGSVQYARERALAYIEEAKKLLVDISTQASPKKKLQLMQLAEYLTQRYF